jgi:hypothetical protein
MQCYKIFSAVVQAVCVSSAVQSETDHFIWLINCAFVGQKNFDLRQDLVMIVYDFCQHTNILVAEFQH